MAASTVQHVAKPSSDQLLRKFADMEPDKPRRRKKARPVRDEPHNSSIAVPERRSLLPVANPKTGTLRQFKAKKPDLRYQMRNRFLLGLVKKTWNHTMERATKMLLEKHCNRHVRLRNEAV
ncbi:uncharacterized protein LOC116248707 [Nymphaea colorata]|nr:uncharacterized protein LOC116248707 [Nymphaea colorata]